MYQCKNCGREFKQKKHLDQHKRRKTPCGKTYKCSKCFKTFPNQRELTRHEKRKTPCAPEKIPVIVEDNPENRCQFCNRTYSNKSNLRRHLKTCDKERNMQVMMKMMQKMDAMQEEMQSMKQQLTVTHPTSVTFNDNRQLHINIVNFPSKELPAIEMKNILEIASSQPTAQIIPTIVQHLHGNPSFPEHQNVFMDEIGSEMTIVFGGDKEKTWHSIPRQVALGHLKNEAMGLLTHNNKPMVNYELIEAAHDVSHTDTSYQDKIADLSQNDPTEDDEIAKKLVEFGRTFHKNRKITV